MLKVLQISNGNYKVKVQSGGSITLDTGFESGEVRITGDLIVEGNTTTVQSENMSVRDNIIILNDGETGSGITLDQSGLRIDRGSISDAFILFDENVTWRDPVSATTINGGFVFKNEVGSLVGIQTNSISTGGGDLYLINNGTGVISVTGTTNYELNVTDDDDITNKKYVDDAITTAFSTVLLSQIGDGTIAPTTVIVRDNETTGNPSLIEFNIDNANIANFYSNRFEFGNIRIENTTIETLSSNSDLRISAPGTGSIILEDNVVITSLPNPNDLSLEPNFPLDGVKLYVKEPSTGGTGLYFANEQSTRDEIISNNRSLIYSMIF